MLMVCEHCRSKDIIAVQGQNYCLNCGRMQTAVALRPSTGTQAVGAQTSTKVIKHKASLKETSRLAEVSNTTNKPTKAKQFISDILRPLEVPELEAPAVQEALPPAAAEPRTRASKPVASFKHSSALNRFGLLAFLPALLGMWSFFLLFYLGSYAGLYRSLQAAENGALLLAAVTTAMAYLLLWLFVRSWASAAVVIGLQDEGIKNTSVARLAWAKAPGVMMRELGTGVVILVLALGVWWMAREWQPQFLVDERVRWTLMAAAGVLALWLSMLLIFAKLAGRYLSIQYGYKLAPSFFAGWGLVKNHLGQWHKWAIAWFMLAITCYGILAAGLALALRLGSNLMVYGLGAVLGAGVLMAVGFRIYSDLYWYKRLSLLSHNVKKTPPNNATGGSLAAWVLVLGCTLLLAIANYWFVWRSEINALVGNLWPFN